MYLWIRNTHLFLGLAVCLFLLMYGVSGVQMSHNTWFNLKPAVTESRATVRAGNGDARAVARELMDAQGLRGELAQVRKTESGQTFRIVRPGTVYEVEYTAQSGEAKIRTNVAGFLGMLNRIHHVGGVWHEYSLINVWGLLVGVVSAALVLSGITGIYLWFKIHAERVIGSILLAAGLAYGLTVIILLRTA